MALLPWVGSGETTRNSFTTVRVARSLEILGSSAANDALAAWYLLPAIAAAAVLLAVTDRTRALLVFTSIAGIASLGLSIAVQAAPVEPLVGARLGGVVGVSSLVATAVVFAVRRSATVRSRAGGATDRPED